MTKSRKVIWTVHVARKRKMGNVYTILVGKPEGKDHSIDPGIDGSITLK
jgi:hypothetical protein